MRILSIRKGFQADHSSTSYEFFAIDKPLTRSERENVAKLSSRARPTKRRVSFIYHGDWNDLPGGWEQLMEKYYDVMYSESYDWWTLAIAFETNKETIKKIKKYEFTGTDDLGVNVDSKNNRVIISISCRLEPGVGYLGNTYDDYYDDKEDELEGVVESEDHLLNLLSENRKYLKKGDYRLLYGVRQKYGFESEDEHPPEPSRMNKLPEPIKSLLSALDKP